MKVLLVVVFVCITTVAGEMCGLSPHGCTHTHCSGDNLQAGCISHECTCITVHACTQHSDCSDINECTGDVLHSPVCHNGRCNCRIGPNLVGR
ncbi:hypothetical protein CHS0354_000920 [Potamilus streckersoni]|uniref:Uncharacterized protein n=1 Tax=Potamilus streckersoni TaxID=2493646 RepID=A0AAE0T6W9_9BIVA|nr:hypothetical protein CHS0354_000920 [Potamilus streckersoni]